jgi:uncharacterized FlgJ-related protein
MKYIITESQTKFIRRYNEIRDSIYDYLLGHNIHPTYKFDDFLTEIAWDVSTDIVSKTSVKGDESVIFRNQMIRFIKNNFYDELKEYWDNK